MYFILNILYAQNELIVVHESDTSRFEYKMLSVFDSLTELNYYKFDILFEKMYIKGSVRTGKYESFFEDGGISVKGNYNSKGLKEGLWQHFYVNGKPACLLMYNNGNLRGEAVYYYENGMLKSRGQYVSVQSTEVVKGQVSVRYEELKAGNWKYYYENGQLKSEGNYLDRNPSKPMDMSREENPEVPEVFGKNLKDGKWIHYDQEGNFLKTEFFTSGELTEILYEEYAKD